MAPGGTFTTAMFGATVETLGDGLGLGRTLTRAEGLATGVTIGEGGGVTDVGDELAAGLADGENSPNVGLGLGTMAVGLGSGNGLTWLTAQPQSPKSTSKPINFTIVNLSKHRHSLQISCGLKIHAASRNATDLASGVGLLFLYPRTFCSAGTPL